MKIYRIASMNKEELSLWILNLVNKEYGGPEGSTEGWCGEVAGDIHRYLQSVGEQSQIWSIVQWAEDNYPDVIENPTPEMHNNVLDQIDGIFIHSFVKWNNTWWDGKGNRSLNEILSEQSWGSLGNGISIMREF